MTKLVIAGVLALASVAAADGKPQPEPAKAKSTCKRVDHKTVCTIEAPVVVTAPKPNVVIVPEDGRKTVGRPKTSDRFTGLSHQLR